MVAPSSRHRWCLLALLVAVVAALAIAPVPAWANEATDDTPAEEVPGDDTQGSDTETDEPADDETGGDTTDTEKPATADITCEIIETGILKTLDNLLGSALSIGSSAFIEAFQAMLKSLFSGDVSGLFSSLLMSSALAADTSTTGTSALSLSSLLASTSSSATTTSSTTPDTSDPTVSVAPLVLAGAAAGMGGLALRRRTE